MTAPLTAMRECLDNLIETWGIDPVQDKTLTRRPVPDLSSVRRLQRAYPMQMVQAGQSAVVPVRIMVDAAGQASQCVVQLPHVERAFKEAVCDRLAERFSPALDKDGQPVASVFHTTVIYQINS
jgi:outer membrane biosynthesis protein TonB